MLALTGTSPSRFSLRVGVTVTVSNNVAIFSTTLDFVRVRRHRCRPLGESARADDERQAADLEHRTGEPAVRTGHRLLLRVRWSRGTLTEAPETAPPASSRTTAGDGSLGRRGGGAEQAEKRESRLFA